jgi:hypothetical protein
LSTTPEDQDYYELRLYRCTPGRMPDLHHRMGYELPPLFARHGVVRPLAYWEGYAGAGAPLYVYMLRWRDLDERFRAFGAFYNDPEWAAQRDASNAGEHMVERVDLALMRPAAIWSEFKQSHEPVEVGGIHELRLQQLDTRNVPASYRALAEVDMPHLKAHGAQILGIFSMWFGSRTPQAVYLLAWRDFQAREAAAAAHEQDRDVHEARRAEARRYGGSLFGACDSHVLQPARYGVPRSNLSEQPH